MSLLWCLLAQLDVLMNRGIVLGADEGAIKNLVETLPK